MPDELTLPAHRVSVSPSQRCRILAAYAVAAAVGFTVVGVGHATTTTVFNHSTPAIRRALDLRGPRVEHTEGHTSEAMSGVSLTVEPVAIVGTGNDQALELRVESEAASPIPLGTRYAMSWQLLDREGNVKIPDVPNVQPLSSDALQVVDRIVIPLSQPDGYYRLEAMIMVADDDELGWSAGGSAYFRIDANQLLLLDAQEWVWESRALDN